MTSPKVWIPAGLLLAGALGGGSSSPHPGLAAGGEGTTGSPEANGTATVLEREAFVMGTRLRVVVRAPDRRRGLRATEAALDAVRATDDRLSTWREDTPLSRVNRAPPGERVTVPPELASLLDEVGRWSARTGGAFDPAVRPLIDAWDLRGSGRLPTERELAAALRSSGMKAFSVDRDRSTVLRRDPAAGLDAGAFGKGAALRAAAEALRGHGVRDGLLDFGGQVTVLGDGPGGRGRKIAVAHPARRGEAVVPLRLRDRTAATTGASERFVEVGGRRFGHVLDPRTGRPVPDWGSVTVVTRDPLAADVLSTALFVMGPDRALAWGRTRDDVGVLVMKETPDGLDSGWNPAMTPFLAGPLDEGPLDESEHERKNQEIPPS